MARPHRCERFKYFEGDRRGVGFRATHSGTEWVLETIRLIFGDFGLAGSVHSRPRYRNPKRGYDRFCKGRLQVSLTRHSSWADAGCGRNTS